MIENNLKIQFDLIQLLFEFFYIPSNKGATELLKWDTLCVISVILLNCINLKHFLVHRIVLKKEINFLVHLKHQISFWYESRYKLQDVSGESLTTMLHFTVNTSNVLCTSCAHYLRWHEYQVAV